MNMDAKTLIESFYQGQAGNCVSVACIKAGMAKFGEVGVFDTLTKDDSGTYTFAMKDGFTDILRDHQVYKAAILSRFLKGDDQNLFDQANIYFGTMAKRVQDEGEIDTWLNFGTFGEALRTLDKGLEYYQGVKLLGLVQLNRSLQSMNDINPANPVIAASDDHCFLIYGGFYEKYGDAKPLSEIANDDAAFQPKYFIEL